MNSRFIIKTELYDTWRGEDSPELVTALDQDITEDMVFLNMSELTLLLSKQLDRYLESFNHVEA